MRLFVCAAVALGLGLGGPAQAQTRPNQARALAWDVCRSFVDGASAQAANDSLVAQGFTFESLPGFVMGYGWEAHRHLVTIILVGEGADPAECGVMSAGPDFDDAAMKAAAREFATSANAVVATDTANAFHARWGSRTITLDRLDDRAWRLRIGRPEGVRPDSHAQ